MKNLPQKTILFFVIAASFTLNAQDIGDVYEGGYIFQINDDGTGLVADLHGLGHMTWVDAMAEAPNANSQDYNDWYLPTREELELMYYNIGKVSPLGNRGNFENVRHWSSTEANNEMAVAVFFGSGHIGGVDKILNSDVRLVRSVNFGLQGCTNDSALNYNENAVEDDGSCVDVVEGCIESTMSNYNAEANTDDDSCVTWEEFAGDLQAQLDDVPTQSIPLNLPEGWSMFGYTCLDSVDAATGFSEIANQIEIVKDEWGLSYLPSWDFNALGGLHYSEGYQIKMKEAITNFQFCETIVVEDGITQAHVDAAYIEGAASVTPEDGITQADVDAAVAATHAMYQSWCASDLDNDGICDVDEVSGCMDQTACNYNSEAEFSDDSCENISCIDACGVMYGDGSSCLDCAGVPNGTAEDLGCGCGNPAAQEGYDCDGNPNQVNLNIGDIHEGGMVFQINEDGTGLVADIQDWGGNETWADVMSAADASTSGGYNDWYLPNIDELTLIYNTIAHGGSNGNILGIYSFWYWSSTAAPNGRVEHLFMSNGSTGLSYKTQTLKARFIRAF